MHLGTTRRLFWEDAYIREFDARVAGVDGSKVRLDQTAFNPRGGGLVSDTGVLAGLRVTEVLKEAEEDISHILDGAHGLKVGDAVHGAIDWEKRYRIMRMHTTAHLLSAIVNKETGALITGNQIAPEGSRIDFSLEQFDRGKIGEYVEKANRVVRDAVEVRSYFMRREEALNVPGLVKLARAVPPSVEELRIVQIGDVDTQADGGVHVRNTNEIGEINVGKIENKGKSNRRLYFVLKP